jgi:hypothetical protein
VADYEQALNLDPEYVPARYNRVCAWSLLHAGDHIEPELRWILERQPPLLDEAATDNDLEWARNNLPAVAALLRPSDDR